MTQAILDRFLAFHRSLEAARDIGKPSDDPYVQGMRAGLQIAITCVEGEAEIIRAGMAATEQLECSHKACTYTDK